MMRRLIGYVSATLLAAATGVAAQEPRPKSGTDADADVVRRGSLLFRARCAGCHGLDARGVSGPDLTMVLATGMTDDRFLRIVRTGLGTEMPRFTSEQTTDTQVHEILAHLRALTTAAAAAAEAPRGNAENGARLFQARCASCHKVNGRGGSLGPDLSRIGALRSASAIAAKVRDPNRSITQGFRPVTLVLADGRRIRGVIKNEDAFSIQVMDVGERLQGFPKLQVRETIREQRSPMPAFGAASLSDANLTDLITYLSTLRGAGTAPAN